MDNPNDSRLFFFSEILKGIGWLFKKLFVILGIIDAYDEYVESGEKAKEIEAIRRQIESMK
jgi:hypothetical protein